MHSEVPDGERYRVSFLLSIKSKPRAGGGLVQKLHREKENSRRVEFYGVASLVFRAVKVFIASRVKVNKTKLE